jgi:replicative DNA helicase
VDDATATREPHEIQTAPETTDQVERAFLASLMMLDRAATWGKASTLVAPDALVREAHRVIYDAIREVAKTHDPDLTSVIAQLDDDGLLERAGGMGYVSGILDCGPCCDNLIEYAKRIKARRALAKAKAVRR